MTRKRFVKILLSVGVGKREAERKAMMQRKYCGQYCDIRQDGTPWWNLFHLEICRFLEQMEEAGGIVVQVAKDITEMLPKTTLDEIMDLVTEEVHDDIQRKKGLALPLSDQPETGKGAGR